MEPTPAVHQGRERLAAWLKVDPGPPIGPSYALRTASASAIAFFGYRLLGAQTGIWAVVSAVVVIMPEVRASVATAALRVAANVVGATAGFVIGLLIGEYQLLALVVGMFTVAFFCRLLRIDAAARSGSVSAAIVLLKDPNDVLGSTEMRVLGVFVGCAVALLVTAIADRTHRSVAAGG